MKHIPLRIQILLAVIVWNVTFLPFVAGCGKSTINRADVSGEVKLDGKPLDEGTIRFTPCAGAKGSVAGGSIKNGRYSFTGAKGVTIGENKVEIHAFQDTGKTYQPYGSGTSMVPQIIDRVAPRFNTKSTLVAEVKSGENTLHFEVASK